MSAPAAPGMGDTGRGENGAQRPSQGHDRRHSRLVADDTTGSQRVGTQKRDGTSRYPRGWHDWYDWALVWRYWNGLGRGLRKPYLREIDELLRLGRDLTQAQLAERLGLPERTICRWRSR